MQRRQIVGASLAGLQLAGLAPAQQTAALGVARVPGLFLVTDYNTHGDGKTLDTRPIQAAIDACTQSGGGIVFFPPGRYLSGTLVLKDNVVLHLSAGATLLGSQNTADYPAKPFPALDLDTGGFQVWALIYAENARNAGIEGKGVIDGNGKPFVPNKPRNPDGSRSYPATATSIRPRLLFLKGCHNLTLRDVTLRDGGMWMAHLALCEKAFIDGVSLYSNFFVNQDGIVIDSCREVFVRDCYLDTEDDCIVLKASYPRRCENVVVSNCICRSRVAAIKFGTQSLGGFRNISISNCSFYNCQLGGLKFFTVDGGDLEDVTVSNIVMHDVSAPLFFRRGNRGFDFGFQEVTKPRPVARVRNIQISEIRATVTLDPSLRTRKDPLLAGATMGIAGLPGYPVEDIFLDNINVTFPGGGTLPDAQRTNVPERETAYPENTMFGVLPCYGMYLRHAKGIVIRNLRLELAAPDYRPAIVAEDVDGLEIIGLRATVSGKEPLIRLRDTRAALVEGCRATAPVTALVAVQKSLENEVVLIANDPRNLTDGIAVTRD